jgi:16S rRNA (uracil1498-N3)-methyltransferase
VFSSPERPCPIGLALGLAKGEKPDRIVAEATALGVRRLAFVEARRSVVRLAPERAEARRERWRRVAVEAARQSGRGALPILDGPMGLGALVSALGQGPRVVLDRGGPPLLSVLGAWDGTDELTLLVGPEGGFEPGEIDAARRAGFAPARLGAHVLRSELAAVAALSASVAFASQRALLADGEPTSGSGGSPGK